MSKNNIFNRSVSRGVNQRGNSSLGSASKEAFDISKKSTLGHYRVEFTNCIYKATERDIQLRRKYGIDLISNYVGVPIDMINLKDKTKEAKQTLTSVDEVFYVKVGKDNYGKLSIRTQRTWRGVTLVFVFQAKKNAIKPPKKSFSRKPNYKPRTKGQKQQASRKSYQNRQKKSR